jgi:hypothetical protein
MSEDGKQLAIGEVAEQSGIDVCRMFDLTSTRVEV